MNRKLKLSLLAFAALVLFHVQFIVAAQTLSCAHDDSGESGAAHAGLSKMDSG